MDSHPDKRPTGAWRATLPWLVGGGVTALLALAALAWWTRDPIGHLRCPYPRDDVTAYMDDTPDDKLPEFRPPNPTADTLEWTTASGEKILTVTQRLRADATPHPIGPRITPDADGKLTLPDGESARILGFAVWDYTRDAANPIAYFDYRGRPLPAAAFTQKIGGQLRGSYGFAHGIAVLIQSAPGLPLIIDMEEMRPRDPNQRYAWFYPVGGSCTNFDAPKSGEVRAVIPWSCRPLRCPLEINFRLLYGTPVPVPIPAHDGEISRTHHGAVRRLLTWPHPLNQSYVGTAQPNTARFVSDNTRREPHTLLEIDSWRYRLNLEGRCHIYYPGYEAIPTATIHADTLSEWPHSARIRVPIPNNLPQPDFRSLDALDTPIKDIESIDKDALLTVTLNAMGISLNYPGRQADWDLPHLKHGDHPGIKTVRDLVRILARQPELAGLTPEWNADAMELRFTRPKPWWKRAVLGVDELAPGLVPDAVRREAQAD